MTSAVPKMQILSIYKLLMRESQKFHNYNFRAYALRKVRDAFKENKAITDQKVVKKEFEYAKENLNIIRRQVSIEKMLTLRSSSRITLQLGMGTKSKNHFEVAIGDMYRTEKLVIENSHQ